MTRSYFGGWLCLASFKPRSLPSLSLASLSLSPHLPCLVLSCLSQHLDIKTELCNDLVWTLARDELKNINSYDTPVDKIACIVRSSLPSPFTPPLLTSALPSFPPRSSAPLVLSLFLWGDQMRCSSVIFRSLNLARAKTEDTVSASEDQAGLSAPGADDFLPLLIWVVLHCHVSRLVSNCEYIHSFHNPIHLRGKAGYCLVNLRCISSFPSLLCPLLS
jgi:hypothetical protein